MKSNFPVARGIFGVDAFGPDVAARVLPSLSQPETPMPRVSPFAPVIHRRTIIRGLLNKIFGALRSVRSLSDGTLGNSCRYVDNGGIMAGGGDEDEAVPDRLLEAHLRQVKRDSDGVEHAAGDQQQDHRRRQAQQKPWIG